jgi:hypothetical protein
MPKKTTKKKVVATKAEIAKTQKDVAAIMAGEMDGIVLVAPAKKNKKGEIIGMTGATVKVTQVHKSFIVQSCAAGFDLEPFDLINLLGR